MKERSLHVSGLDTALIFHLINFRSNLERDPEAEEIPILIKDTVSNDTKIRPIGNK